MIITERPQSTKSPAFQFYPADFISDENVKLMTNQQIGCYIVLLCHCWIEGSIPADVTKIAKLCGENGSAMADLWLGIRSCFVEMESKPERLINPRLYEERRKQEQHRSERSSTGLKGAKARWDKPSANSCENGSAMDQPSNSHGSAIQEPIAKNASSSLSSSSVKDIDHHEEETPSVEPVVKSPLAQIEDYLKGRTRSMMLGGTSLEDVKRWVALTGGNVQVVKDGIDAGFDLFRKDKPQDLPRTAQFYTGYVEKAWDRHKAIGGEKDGRTSSSPGTTPGKAPGTGTGRTGPATARTINPNSGRGSGRSRQSDGDLDALSIK